MGEARVYNFAAGPSQLPLPVLEQAGREMMNYHGTGMSVMEMSHRSSVFRQIAVHARDRFRELMNVPDTHDILFLQGGASSQFSMVPLNLMTEAGAEYALTGSFSAKAAAEAEKYGNVHIVFDGRGNGYSRIPDQSELKLKPGSSYFHYCENNTIYGTAWHYMPQTDGVPLVCDMSSSLTSHPVDFLQYDVVYAGAQKNMAPAGLTLAVVRRDAAGHESASAPLMMSYQRMIESGSMYNTPPCWQIYMFGLQMDWLAGIGVEEMEKINRQKADLLYGTLENCPVFHLHAEKNSRSLMNVTFRTADEEMDREFICGAEEVGLVNLKGHRLTGGMRASIYNAMPPEGVKALCGYIESFDRKHRRQAVCTESGF